MRPIQGQHLWLPLLGALPALATFENFFFAGNGGNDTATRKCGTGVGSLAYSCVPPQMCSQDTLTNKYYCCNPGDPDAQCWTGASTCDGTTTGSPSAQQTGCTLGSVKYCCLGQTEKCTQAVGQFNICWSTFDNPLRSLNKTLLNQTYSSLSSASPSATVYSISRSALNALSQTTAGASSSASASASTTPSSSSSSTSSSSPSPKSDSGLSGGAIGGIVGGVVGGLALLAIGAFFLWRRRKSTGKIDPHAQAGDPYQGYGYQQQYQPGSTAPSQGFSPQPNVAQLHSNPPPLDKYAHVHQPEVAEAPSHHGPVEMDASYYQQASASPPPKHGQMYA